MLAQEWGDDLDPRPQHEHKSVAQATRYANAGGGLRECEARSNPVINKLKVKKFYTRIEWVMK